ncbi:hypothetical protein ABPG72_008854 [Tetrahymena utriculariae]
MKYYKDDVLNKFTATFKDSEIENKFHVDLYSKRFKLVYLIAVQVIVQNSSLMIFVKGYNLYNLVQVVAAVIFMSFIKFAPRKYSQYIIIFTQIFTTYSICSVNQINTNKDRELYFLNGITQVMYWIVECQNFLAESFSMFINFGIITYYQQIPYNYSINYFLAIIIICFYKYSHNINDRKLYLALKNFQEWERLSEKIIPNLFILQSFDYRTHRMKVYDCNERAKKFQITQSQEKYIQFLSQLKIEEFLTITKPFDSFFNSQGILTLKDYLLNRHEEMYRVYIESNTNTQKKFQQMKIRSIRQSSTQNSPIKSQRECDKSQDFVENLSVSMLNQETQKKICFKVKIFALNMNEPFLIICMEDISLFQKIQYLKEKQLNQIDLVHELVQCLEDKIQYLQYVKQSSIRNLQRQIMQFKLILQSFQQKFKPLNVQQFYFSEVIDKIKLIYSDQNLKILGDYSDLLIFSDKKYIFKSIFAVISSLAIENIISIEIDQLKDKLSEKIILNINTTNSEQINQLEKSFYLFDLRFYSKINSICFGYLQNLMKSVCLRDTPYITFMEDNQIKIQIEYLTDINLLRESQYNQDKFILSPQMLKKTTCTSLINTTKSNNFQTIAKHFTRCSSKLTSIKLIEPIKEQQHHQLTEDQIRLDSIQSSQLCVKFISKETDSTKNDKPIANFAYNFQNINSLSNQRKNMDDINSNTDIKLISLQNQL